jgi:class 3 adenylate cyclase
VKNIFQYQWTEETTKTPPGPENLKLNSNHAKYIKTAVVLYADIDSSTSMVDNQSWGFSAEVYKAFLRCAAAVVRAEGGSITAYDGDRVMAVFAGGTPNTDAVRSALKINWAVRHIIQPAINNQYPDKTFKLKHVVGIDVGELRAARVGVHGENDIVWVGRPANHAAKLCALSSHPTWITKAVYDCMLDPVKLSSGTNMWAQHSWTTMKAATIYGSTYRWAIG